MVIKQFNTNSQNRLSFMIYNVKKLAILYSSYTGKISKIKKLECEKNRIGFRLIFVRILSENVKLFDTKSCKT